MSDSDSDISIGDIPVITAGKIGGGGKGKGKAKSGKAVGKGGGGGGSRGEGGFERLVREAAWYGWLGCGGGGVC